MITKSANIDYADLTISSRDMWYKDLYSTEVLKKKITTSKMDCCKIRKWDVESTELLNLTKSPSEFSCEQLSQSFFDDIDMDPVEVAQISFTGPLQDGILSVVIVVEDLSIGQEHDMYRLRKGTHTSVESTLLTNL